MDNDEWLISYEALTEYSTSNINGHPGWVLLVLASFKLHFIVALYFSKQHVQIVSYPLFNMKHTGIMRE
jgi:hypothetical protein